MIIASVLGGQVPLVIVHTNVFTPVVSPVTPEVGLVGVVTTPVPAVTVHAPVPTVGAFAARVAVAEQIVWSGPAAAAVGIGSLLMVIASALGGQVPLVIVHTNVFTPVVKPVTPDVGLLGTVTNPVPAVTVHAPVPTVGAFAAKVAVGLHIVWSGPAADTVGIGSLLMVIASVLGGQVPLVIVHTNVFTPVVKPVTPLVGLVGVVTNPVPAVIVHAPVPTVGAFAAKVAVALQMV